MTTLTLRCVPDTMTTPYAVRLADLPAIGLEALTENAERLTRVDRKYVVPRTELDAVLEAVGEDAVALEIGERRTFGYASTYYDTADLRAFHEGGRSRRRRFKVRTREYLDTGAIWLEVKTRGARGTTVKTRLALDAPVGVTLTDRAAEFVVQTLATQGIPAVDVAALRPALDVRYRRSTLAFLSSGSRTTIDTDLTWRGTGEVDGLTITVPDVAVIETKAGSTPTGVDRALWSRGHRPVRLSKYGAGLAATRPTLPHLKWHRTLTHPLLALAS